MKNIILIYVCILLSCQNEYIITKDRVGKYIIGNKLDTDFDRSTFDIKTDSKGFIKSIIVSSPNYKTVDLFGVGSAMDSIRVVTKTINKNDLTISKGERVIGIFGKRIVYKGVTFIDVDEDNIIDYVWVQKINRE